MYLSFSRIFFLLIFPPKAQKQLKLFCEIFFSVIYNFQFNIFHRIHFEWCEGDDFYHWAPNCVWCVWNRQKLCYLFLSAWDRWGFECQRFCVVKRFLIGNRRSKTRNSNNKIRILFTIFIFTFTLKCDHGNW